MGNINLRQTSFAGVLSALTIDADKDWQGHNINNLDTLEVNKIYNSGGDLKIQPDVQGDVTLFEDTDVADAGDSKAFIVHRKAAEFDTNIKIFLDQYGNPKYHPTQTGGTNLWNTFFGTLSGDSNTSGNYNFGMGAYTLNLNTTGHGNSAMGTNALRVNEDGYNNSAVGYLSLSSNTSGNSNSGIGYLALQSNTTGYQNVAIGTSSLVTNIDGYQNCAIGTYSMRYNGAGRRNCGIGYGAVHDNTTGSYNFGGGYKSMLNNTTGNDNIGIGSEANYYNETGSNNIVIGHQAGYGTGLHNKSGCVLIGHQAGYSDETSDKLYIANSNTATPLIYGEFDNGFITINGYLNITTLKSGATQVAAGAAASELWYTNGHASLPNNVVMMGV